jgi:hypothetical protein
LGNECLRSTSHPPDQPEDRIEFAVHDKVEFFRALQAALSHRTDLADVALVSSMESDAASNTDAEVRTMAQQSLGGMMEKRRTSQTFS